ncbi:unnamed protein product [Paramecium pentaurelia]|uniref:Uncharacterized protein n=1 Tax=Paramecium pentaurelia TaxID=43138 RepID=A0A8S1VQJ3_9CILI|nr:unnamed protein product [Paramecium pentaurelia]
MFKTKMIENEKSLQCAYQHNLPIVQVVLNPLLKKEQRLLCNECLENVDIEGKAVGFKKIIQMIEEQQKLKIDQVENVIIINIKQIQLIQSQIDQLKSNIIQQLDQLKFIVHDWINNLQSLGLRYQNYNFHEELENMINNKNELGFNENLLMKKICEEHNNWNSKLTLKLELVNQFPEYNNLKEILLNHQFMISKFDLIQNKKDEKQILLLKDDIILKQTDFSVKQKNCCVSIAFNSSDSIMVSTNESIIEVWNFNNGRLELLQSLNQHTGWVNALMFSKKQNSFISCSSDKTIRIWKDQGGNDWIGSFPYEQHTHKVLCMTVNQNEDQVFSGSQDKTIIVWKLDFDKNELIYQYSLEKHDYDIYGLSLNQSERQLVSCAYGEDQIIIWERGLNNKMEFKYFFIIVKDQQLNYFINLTKIQDQKYSLSRRISLFGYQIVNKLTKLSYLNYKKVYIKRIRKRKFKQIKIKYRICPFSNCLQQIKEFDDSKAQSLHLFHKGIKQWKVQDS